MVRQITQGRTHCGVEVKIHGTLFLYSEKGWFIMVGSRLQKIKPSHNQRQDTITFDWRSNQQTQGCMVL